VLFIQHVVTCHMLTIGFQLDHTYNIVTGSSLVYVTDILFRYVTELRIITVLVLTLLS